MIFKDLQQLTVIYKEWIYVDVRLLAVYFYCGLMLSFMMEKH